MKKQPDVSQLKNIDYDYPGKQINVNIVTDEFTCICPWSGLPDFAAVTVNYTPDKKCVELKSLKLYLQSYRDVGMVHESVVNRVLDDLVVCCKPIKMEVVVEFKIRGGIKTTVRREFNKH
jgi:7-cyano-7-deazaguanine reductase